MMVLTALLFVTFILATLLLCTPFSAAWNLTVGEGHCADFLPPYLATCSINMIFDFTIVLLPMPVLWKLQMPASKKIVVSSILALGLV